MNTIEWQESSIGCLFEVQHSQGVAAFRVNLNTWRSLFTDTTCIPVWFVTLKCRTHNNALLWTWWPYSYWYYDSISSNSITSILLLKTKNWPTPNTGAHHSDLRAASKIDPHWLLEQRAAELLHIAKWIADYNKEGKLAHDVSACSRAWGSRCRTHIFVAEYRVLTGPRKLQASNEFQLGR